VSLPGLAHPDDRGVDQGDNNSDDDEHKFLEDIHCGGSVVHVRCSWIR